MQVNPYLDFGGRCEEAVNFYKSAVGAEVTMMMRFKESPDQSMMSPGSGDKILHVALRIGESMIFASDGRLQGPPTFKGIALSLTVANDAEAKRVFSALSEGGQVNLPLTKTFFATQFGMLADRFGVGWMVMAPQQQ
jgi:PhnB protein